MEDILAIESKISDVRYELESYQSQMNTYNDLIDYSTVYVSVNEVAFSSGHSDESTGERIKNGFLNSLHDLGKGIGSFFVGLVIGIPYIVFAVLVIALILWIIFRIKKKRKKKSKPTEEVRKTEIKETENHKE